MRSRFSGFSKKSLAPSLMAATASWTVACPLITTTGRSAWLSSARSFSSASSPLMPGSLRSKIAMSTGCSGLDSVLSASSAVAASSTR